MSCTETSGAIAPPAPPAGVRSAFVRAGSFDTHYWEAGDPRAPVLLLLHDGAIGGSAAGSWRSMISPLAERYRVLAPDMLGFGDTDKVVFFDRSPHAFRIAHLADFLSAVGVSTPVSVVGNSFGGAIALRAAASREAFPISTVVSIAGSGGPWRTPIAIEELGRWDGSKSDLARILSLLLDTDSEEFEKHLVERYGWATRPGHLKSIYAATVPTPDSLRVTVDDPWPEQLRDIETPLTLVRCRDDLLLEPEWAERIAAVAPDATVLEIDHRHSPNLDRPLELLALLDETLSSGRVPAPAHTTSERGAG